MRVLVVSGGGHRQAACSPPLMPLGGLAFLSMAAGFALVLLASV